MYEPNSPEELKGEIIFLLKEGKTRIDIAKKYMVNIGKVTRWLKDFGINVKDYYEFRLSYNVHVFDTIDNEEKAYWLGFLYADGCVSYNAPRNCYCISVALKSTDVEHLKKFKDFLQDTRESSIRISTRTFNGKEFEACDYRIYNEHLAKTLINLGCIIRKSLTLTFPDSNVFKKPNLVFDFIRGYVDGDGCLSLKRKSPRISILGTNEFLTEVIKYLPQFNKVYKAGNQFVVATSGDKAKVIANKLYGHATIYLDRKYEKFKALFEYNDSEINNGE